MYHPIRPEIGPCRICKYAVWAYKTWACYYLIHTGHRRPCAPGWGCAVWARREKEEGGKAMCSVCGFTECPDGCPNAARTEAPETATCPVCGQVPELRFYLADGEKVGCDRCIREAWWDEGQ